MCIVLFLKIGFLYFWGIVFLVATTLVGVFKKEVPHNLSVISSAHSNQLDNHSNGSVAYLNQTGNIEGQLSSRNRIAQTNTIDKQISCESTRSRSRTPSGWSRIIEIPPDEELNVTESNKELSLFDTYRFMLGICKLKPILQYILLLFIAKVSNYIYLYLILSHEIRGQQIKEFYLVVLISVLCWKKIYLLILSFYVNTPY